MPRIAVVGLGRFGTTLARELSARGAQVIAIDRNLQLINSIKDAVDVAVRLDSTDEIALLAQEFGEMDVCVVAIGENFEAALLTTVIAKKLGVPRIICRAQSELHAEIFKSIGANEVIQPELQAGEHLSRRLASPQLQDYVALAEGYTLIELLAPTAFHGQTPAQAELRSRYGVNLIAIKRPTTAGPDVEEVEYQVISVPRPDEQILADDVLVLIGSDEALAQLPKE